MDWLLLLLVSFAGGSLQAKERVDIMEINHYYDEDTKKLQFTQVIFWEIHKPTQQKVVVKWYLLNDLHQRPRLVPGTREYVVTWIDEKDRRIRKFYTNILTETWTTYDPERENKKILPEKDRLGILPRVLR